MLGVEIVVDRTTRAPAPERRLRVVQEAFGRGLLLIGCGQSTIRLAPPLMVDTEDVDIAVRILDESITAAASDGSR
jgi:4-aminobutyrate aminotransferase